jgi:hypothetical protein
MTQIIGAFHDYAKSPKTYRFIFRIVKLAPPHFQFEITSKL